MISNHLRQQSPWQASTLSSNFGDISPARNINFPYKLLRFAARSALILGTLPYRQCPGMSSVDCLLAEPPVKPPLKGFQISDSFLFYFILFYFTLRLGITHWPIALVKSSRLLFHSPPSPSTVCCICLMHSILASQDRGCITLYPCQALFDSLIGDPE